MKNSNYFPFERNHYFYGKLLSVDDFELEQRYMNNKRRLINRFILGSGVAAGLYVVAVDEQTLSVEAGFALDSWGREIVVESPVVKKLELIEGFENIRENPGYLYLCLEYDEQEADRVHNIAGTTDSAQEYGDLSYSKIKEGYRLLLTAQEPELDGISPSEWYETSYVIYQKEDIKITARMPRYIRSGRTASLKLQVENLGRSNVSFSFDLVLNHLLAEGKAKLRLSFDEVLFERTGKYEAEYTIQASDAVGEEATATIDPESVVFRLSGAAQEARMSGRLSAKIVPGDEKEAMQEEYYRMSMGKIARGGYQQPVYLAKVYLISAGDTYIVEKIENTPFGQYVPNQVLSTAQFQMLTKEIRELMKMGGLAGGDGEGMPIGEQPEKIQYARGETELRVKGEQRGDVIFSPEIVHGLGLGRATVVLGLESEPGRSVYGAADIFRSENKKKTDVELAACVNEENGSFVIGARLLNSPADEKLKVSWAAFMDREDLVTEKSQRRIFIKPNLLELNVRESHYLEAVCENMVERSVTWKVKDEGGFIDDKGQYTAPTTPGVYEVTAQSVAFPEVKASIFVVVRDVDEEE